MIFALDYNYNTGLWEADKISCGLYDYYARVVPGLVSEERLILVSF
jgi:hypothetical protein